jgi:3-oxoacyl-[acyl-carrier protein] reductase
MDKFSTNNPDSVVQAVNFMLKREVLKGKKCVFLGADSPFSREICKNLAKAGINLGLIDLDPRNCDDLVGELRGYGVKAMSSTVDSSDPKNYVESADKLEMYLDGIDYLICSYYPDHEEDNTELDVDRLSMEKWDEAFGEWVESYFFVTKAVLPYMLKNKFGKIIFMNTLSGYTGEGEGEGQLSYEGSIYECACSSALTGIMTSMARDLIPLGIDVKGIALSSSSEIDTERILNAVVLCLSGLAEYSCGQIIRLY